MTAALKIFRGLLCLYPAEFREHFGSEMCQVLADRLREERGVGSALAAWCAAAAGVLIHAPEEHLLMIGQDIKYAWRTMRHEKLPAIAAITVLALGIGSSTAIFTLVNGVLLRPLPFPAQERLVYVEESGPKIGRGAVAYPNYLDLRARNQSMEDLALYTGGTTNLQLADEAERVPSGYGTASLFHVLGVKPLLGRVFTEDEDRNNGPNVVLLGEDLWRRRLGADPGIIGQTIKAGTSEARVIGVMPSSFHFPGTAELWWSVQLDPKNNTRTDHWLEGVGRLRAGVTVAQAQEEFRALMAQIQRENPLASYGQTVAVSGFAEHSNARIGPVLVTLLGAVGFVLLIACANLMSLLLVKATARGREMAVRGALGASRSRLVRGFVMESVLLGLIGSAGGVLVAWIAVPALVALVPEGTLPRWIAFTPDWRIALFVASVAAGSGVLAGLVPAIAASRQNVIESLKEGGRTSTGGAGTTWLRNALVVGEIAASVLLLVGAGLMMRTLANLQNRQTGIPQRKRDHTGGDAVAARDAGLRRDTCRSHPAGVGVAAGGGICRGNVGDSFDGSVGAQFHGGGQAGAQPEGCSYDSAHGSDARLLPHDGYPDSTGPRFQRPRC
jgi:putative ABC transport system permease protein